MKFWLYSIDWRSMAIEIVGEFPNAAQADLGFAKHIAAFSKTELDTMVKYKTLAITPVSEEMMAAREQFLRLNGRVA